MLFVPFVANLLRIMTGSEGVTMVVLQRNEVRRHRLVFFLTLILSVITLISIILNFSGASQPTQIGLVILGAAAVVALFLSILQLYTLPKRSKVLLFQNDDEIVIAINALHEGFKLRFLRDILGENVSAFTDEDRIRWKALEADGFYATLYVRNIRKVIMLRLCTMIFDDVFVADRNNRWEHHDSSSTAEPSFSRREMPPLTSWKSST
jgi:hypothetical protein